MTTNNPPRRLDPDSAEVLYVAAVCGVDELARQLVRFGISVPHEAQEDAKLLRVDLLETVARMTREEAEG
jgi:hypothetical protein